VKLFRCYSNPNEQTARYAARERRWMGPWRKKGGRGADNFRSRGRARIATHRSMTGYGTGGTKPAGSRRRAAGGTRSGGAPIGGDR